MYVTASKSVIPYGSARVTRQIILTSIVVSPVSEAAVSAKATFYAATAVTANAEFMSILCGTAPRTVVWNDANGIEVDKLFVTAASAFVTLVWK